MAEPSAATQSPSVSSSSSSSSGAESSALGGGSPGACPAPGAKSCGGSCADPFASSSSSSQPVSLFSTSQEGLSSLCSSEQPSETMASSERLRAGPTAPPGEQSRELASQPVLARENKDQAGWAPLGVEKAEEPQGAPAAAPPSTPDSPPDQAAFLSEEQQMNSDRESKDPKEKPRRDDRGSWGAGDRFTLPTAQNPPAGLPKAAGSCPHSLSPKVSGGGADKDSPESPFEVITDREFREVYKESQDDPGSWAVLAERGSPADLLEAKDRLFPLRSVEAGRYPASALLSRQFAHTTAALQEVSRCVNDMHNFTNEVLTWDLLPQVREQSDRSDGVAKATGPDPSGSEAEIIPVVNLKTSARQKPPVRPPDGGAPGTKPADEAEAPGSAQKRGDPLSRTPGAPVERSRALGCAVKVLFPGGHLEGDVLGEGAEADSSGESDDTVTEDGTADLPLEKPVSTPRAAAEAGGEAEEEVVGRNRGDGGSETSAGAVGDSEPQSACSPAPAVDATTPVAAVAVAVGSVSEAASEKPPVAATKNPAPPPAASPGVSSETRLSGTVTPPACRESPPDGSPKGRGGHSAPGHLVVAPTESGGKGLMGASGGRASGAASEEAAGAKTPAVKTPQASRSGSGTQRAETRGGAEVVPALPAPGSPGAGLDLEQEQLTIRALKELSERPVPARQKAASPAGALPHALTFAPESARPPRPRHDPQGCSDSPGSALDMFQKPSAVKEPTKIDISDLSKTDLKTKHVLARLLTDFSVHDLIFWRDAKKTGVVFGGTLVTLLSLAAFSVISVVSYLILALLSVTISFRVYKSVIQAVQKSEEGHPFKAYLDVDITLSSEAFHNYVNAAMVHINKTLKLVIRLFLVEDLVDSLKLAVFMWLMTYVGAVFNGITLLILAELLIFSVPIVYEKYKTQIDHYVSIVRDQTKSIVEKIQAKLPGIVKKKAE